MSGASSPVDLGMGLMDEDHPGMSNGHMGGGGLGGGGSQNPNEGVGPDGQPAKKRRNRKPVTCSSCRKRKLKCDRGHPCGACRDRNEGHLCSWDDAIRLPQQNVTRDQEAFELRSQLDRLESLLGLLQSNNYEASSPPKGGLGEGGLPYNGKARSTTDFESERNTAVEALGLLSTRGTTSYGPPSSLSPFSLICNSPSSSSAGAATLSPILNALPARSELESLIECFIKDHFWALPVFHLPSFRQRFNRFRELRSTTSVVNKVTPISTGGDTQEDRDPFFLALVLSICGITTFFRGSVDDSLLLPGTQANGAAWKGREQGINSYLEASMSALQMGRYMETRSLDSVRTLFIISEYYKNVDSGACSSTFSLAIQLAHRMGLDRDPPFLLLGSPIEIEQRRRLWYMLITADWLHDSGRTYRCQPSQFDTKAPLHSDDEDITEDSATDRPLSQATLMTHVLFKYRIAEVARRVTEKAYGVRSFPSFQDIEELDQAIHDLEHSLQRDFHRSLALEWENGMAKPFPQNAHPRDALKFHIQIHLKELQIRLHRPFLTRGFADPSYSQSRENCISAARFILAIHRGLGLDVRVMRWWHLTFAVCNALIVLAIDLFQDPNGPKSGLNQADVGSSLALLRKLENRSAAVRETIRICESLGRQAQKSLNDPSTKRRRSDEEFVPSGLPSPSPSDLNFFNHALTPISSFRASMGEPGGAGLPPFPSLGLPVPGPDVTASPMSMHPPQPLVPVTRMNNKYQAFSRPLPIPLCVDPLPFMSPGSIAYSGATQADQGFAALWKNVSHMHTIFYALPDREEWAELQRGGRQWTRGIDLLFSAEVRLGRPGF